MSVLVTCYLRSTFYYMALVELATAGGTTAETVTGTEMHAEEEEAGTSEITEITEEATRAGKRSWIMNLMLL
jgi:hypothetical protein